jgi:hypothetical protein
VYRLAMSRVREKLEKRGHIGHAHLTRATEHLQKAQVSNDARRKTLSPAVAGAIRTSGALGDSTYSSGGRATILGWRNGDDPVRGHAIFAAIERLRGTYLRPQLPRRALSSSIGTPRQTAFVHRSSIWTQRVDPCWNSTI